ncbi:MAG: tRNA lysidine(34) synthetase TilS [Bacilli bacterium]|nr:tRNA lysidine(34) synthetase TilS [Bacilli bacterium]
MDCITKIRNDVKEVVKKIITNNNTPTFLVAVSCGVDSICLLHELEYLRDNEINFDIVVCHVNHGKRKQSDVEEEYIRRYCDAKNLKLYVLKLQEEDFSGSNFQEEARKKRIEFFLDVAKKENTKYIFLAHHKNDDIETIIMEQMRNASIQSLCGLKEISYLKNKDVYFVRPFINILKEDLYNLSKVNNYTYFEDYTNNEDNYTRNKVRHYLVNSTVNKNNIDEFIDGYKKQMINLCNSVIFERDEFIDKYCERRKDKTIIDLKHFSILDDEIKIDCLFEILKEEKFSRKNIEEILKLFCISGNKKINYKNILIIKEYDKLTFIFNTYLDSLDDYNSYEIVLNDFGYYKIDGSHFVEIDSLDEKKSFKVSNKDIICYNQSMFPFILRGKQDGDRILIKGGSKKVNDLLTDLKVPLSKREQVRVLVDKMDRIIAVLGLRKSYILNEYKDDQNCNIIIKTNYLKDFE